MQSIAFCHLLPNKVHICQLKARNTQQNCPHYESKTPSTQENHYYLRPQSQRISWLWLWQLRERLLLKTIQETPLLWEHFSKIRDTTFLKNIAFGQRASSLKGTPRLEIALERGLHGLYSKIPLLYCRDENFWRFDASYFRRWTVFWKHSRWQMSQWLL